jgi:hypothetical protein
MAVIWDVTSCTQAEIHRSLKGAYCLHHQGALMKAALNTSETSANFCERGAIPQKVAIFMLAAVGTCIFTMLVFICRYQHPHYISIAEL